MEYSTTEKSRIEPGRFIIENDRSRFVGLSVEQAAKALNTPDGHDARIFRIHRVDENGRTELVGVSAGAFTTEDCLIFHRPDVAAARRDYDAILEHAGRHAPPCGIQLLLAHAPSFSPPHVVALIFIAACAEPVGQWLRLCEAQPGDSADGGPAALAAWREADPQIVKSEIVQPDEDRD